MPTTTTLHEAVTAKIIKAIEQGQTPPWRRPISDLENDGFPSHPATLKPFIGIDVLLVNLAAQDQGFRSKCWATEQEWAYLDTQVAGQATILANGTPVFNADQLLMSPGAVAYRSRRRLTPVTVDYAPAEAVIAASGADIRHVVGLEAAYYYQDDFIIFPEKWQFVLEAYYDSLFHEVAGHWTESRLGFEGSSIICELRAEIAAPFLTSQLGIPVLADMQMLRNHQKHLSRWLTAMRQDPSLIFKVAESASQAAAYLLSLRV